MVTLNPPAGSPLFTNIQASDGTQLCQDPAGRIVVPQNLLSEFTAQGWTIQDAAGTTGERPTTGTYPGMSWFDTTLDRPVWRDAQNSGWIFGDGSSAA